MELIKQSNDEIAIFRCKLTEEADETGRSLKTRLEAVEQELQTTKAALAEAQREADGARNDLRLYREHHSRALKDYSANVHEDILYLKKTVGAVINRDAFEKERKCLDAYGRFMWEALRDAIPPEKVADIEKKEETARRAVVSGQRRYALDVAIGSIVSLEAPPTAQIRISSPRLPPSLSYKPDSSALRDMGTHRPYLRYHLQNGRIIPLMFASHSDQHTLTGLDDPVTLLDYLLRLERVGITAHREDDYAYRTYGAGKWQERVEQVLAAMGPSYATSAIFELGRDPAAPGIPRGQLWFHRRYFGEEGRRWLGINEEEGERYGSVTHRLYGEVPGLDYQLDGEEKDVDGEDDTNSDDDTDSDASFV
ncbi:hypothetical protein IAT38_005916 [Cryptococcus sp. DSM 104549]